MSGNLYQKDGSIDPKNYPELQDLMWFMPGVTSLSQYEAFDLYEKLWAYVHVDALCQQEVKLITDLAKRIGKGNFHPVGGQPIELEGVYCD